jgi:hypothetical protein
MTTVNAVSYSAERSESGLASFKVRFYVEGKLYEMRELYSAYPRGWHTVFYSAEYYGGPYDVSVIFPWSKDWKKPDRFPGRGKTWIERNIPRIHEIKATLFINGKPAHEVAALQEEQRRLERKKARKR